MNTITIDNLNALEADMLENKAQNPTIITEFYCSSKTLEELFEKGFFDSISLYTVIHENSQVKVIIP
jgi:hypothetical protein